MPTGQTLAGRAGQARAKPDAAIAATWRPWRDKQSSSGVPPLSRSRDGSATFRDRRGHVLFIDARKLGPLVDRTRRELTDEDIARIAGTYHAWRSDGHSRESGNLASYADVPGFCKCAPLEEIRTHGHVLTPGRYVGADAIEDDGEPFEAKMKRLTAQLEEQLAEGARLERAIRSNLAHLGFEVGMGEE